MFDKIKKLYTNFMIWVCGKLGLNYDDILRIEPAMKPYFRAAFASVWHWSLFNLYWKIGNMYKAGYHYDYMRWEYKTFIGYDMMIRDIIG